MTVTTKVTPVASIISRSVRPTAPIICCFINLPSGWELRADCEYETSRSTQLATLLKCHPRFSYNFPLHLVIKLNVSVRVALLKRVSSLSELT